MYGVPHPLTVKLQKKKMIIFIKMNASHVPEKGGMSLLNAVMSPC